MQLYLPLEVERNLDCSLLDTGALSQCLHCNVAICSPKCGADISAVGFHIMNDYSQPGAGKISVHGNGVGAPSPEEVEKRAREIAMINGATKRIANHVPALKKRKLWASTW